VHESVPVGKREGGGRHCKPDECTPNRSVAGLCYASPREPIDSAVLSRAHQAHTAPAGSRCPQLMRPPDARAAARAGHEPCRDRSPRRMRPQPGSVSFRPGAMEALAPAEAGRRARRGGPERAGGQAHRPRATALGDGAVAQQWRRQAQLRPRRQGPRVASGPGRDAQRRAQRVAQLVRGLAARQQRRDRRGRRCAPVLRGPAAAAGARAVSGTCGPWPGSCSARAAQR